MEQPYQHAIQLASATENIVSETLSKKYVLSTNRYDMTIEIVLFIFFFYVLLLKYLKIYIITKICDITKLHATPFASLTPPRVFCMCFCLYVVERVLWVLSLVSCFVQGEACINYSHRPSQNYFLQTWHVFRQGTNLQETCFGIVIGLGDIAPGFTEGHTFKQAALPLVLPGRVFTFCLVMHTLK